MSKQLATKIGKRVRVARKTIALSQKAFAERVGITRGFLSDVERGTRTISVETLLAICKVTGVTPNTLLRA